MGGYNGWRNYETWAVALWIDNEQGSYSYSREMVSDAVESHALDPNTEPGETVSVSDIADRLKDWIEESAPEMEASLYSDLLNAALSEVDWYEIAENYLEEVTEDR